MDSENMIKITVGSFMGILIAISLIIGIGNKETIKILWQKNNELGYQVIQLRTDIDVLKGQMKIFEHLPIDLRARIGILETRYENLVFFQRQIDKKGKLPD